MCRRDPVRSFIGNYGYTPESISLIEQIPSVSLSTKVPTPAGRNCKSMHYNKLGEKEPVDSGRRALGATRWMQRSTVVMRLIH